MPTTHTRPNQQPQSKQLFKMTTPMLLGVISLMSFQLIDSIFISQLGIEPLAVLGFTIPIYQAIIGIQVGLGIATTAIIPQLIGAGEQTKAQQTAGVVLLTGASLIALLCTLLWIFRAPITQALGATANLMPMIDSFWPIWLASAWIGAMLYFGYSICRAQGNTLIPGAVMVATSLLNIALDPIFIFVFDLGLPGAAIATFCSFLIGAFIIYPKLINNNWFSFNFSNFSIKQSLLGLSKTMAPAMVSQLLPAVSASLATALIAGFGAAAVAAWALGTRLEFFSIVIVLALTMSLPPMVGRLYGERNINDIISLVKLAVKFVIFWQLAIALIGLAGSQLIAGIFTDDQAVASILIEYIIRVPVSYSALGVCMMMVSVCNAIGLPLKALIISCLRLFVCYLPCLWLGAQLTGINGLLSGAMVGNLAAGLLAWIMYQQSIRALKKEDLSGNS